MPTWSRSPTTRLWLGILVNILAYDSFFYLKATELSGGPAQVQAKVHVVFEAKASCNSEMLSVLL